MTARTATEAAAPALLLSSAAIGRPDAAGALLVSSLTISAALTGPVVGSVLDRARRPPLVFLTAMGLLASGFTVLALLPRSTPLAAAVAVAVAAGLGHPALTGGWSAQLARVVPAQRHAAAYALDAATYNLGGLAGPAVAALLLIAFGERGPLAGVAVLMALPALLLPTLRLSENRLAATGSAAAPAGRFTDGARAMATRPGLRAGVLVTTIGLAGQAPIVVTAPATARALGQPPAFVGTFLTGLALGGLAGTVIQGMRPLPRPQVVTFIGTLAVGVSMCLLALATALPSTPLAVAAVIGVGAAGGLLTPAVFVVRSRNSPQASRNQVFTIAASLRTTGWALTAAALAPVAHSPVTALLIGAGVQVLALAAGVLGAGRRPRDLLVRPAATGPRGSRPA